MGAGLGAAILPSLSIDACDQATVTLELSDSLPERLIVLVRHREREYSPLALALAEIVERELGHA